MASAIMYYVNLKSPSTITAHLHEIEKRLFQINFTVRVKRITQSSAYFSSLAL